MDVIDLFSGIGGFSLALERCGMRTVAFCECDPFCRAVLRKHWPGVPCYDDVRTVDAVRLAADGIRGDLICGGFPCQDISTAGKRVGIDGARSGLWREFARIIGDVRPRYVLVENVAALLGGGISRVLGDVAALGYDAEWHCIPACAVGAPHRRDRVWILAYARRDFVWLEQQRMSGRWSTRICNEGQAGSRNDGAAQSLADASDGRESDRPWPSRRELGERQTERPLARRDGEERHVADAARGEQPGEQTSLDDAAMVGASARASGGIAGGDSAPRVCLDRGVATGRAENVADADRGRCEIERQPQHAAESGASGDQPDRRGAAGWRNGAASDGGRAGDLADARRPLLEGWRAGPSAWWESEPDVGRVAHGVPRRVDRLKCLGNAVVPQVVEVIGRAIMDAERDRAPGRD